MRTVSASARAFFIRQYDWLLIVPAVLLSFIGLVTMNAFTGHSVFFERQALWILAGVCAMIAVSFVDVRSLYRTSIIMALYLGTLAALVLVLLFGTVVMGAQNRFDLGWFALQPSDPAQFVLVLVLAKYFARRHVEIAHLQHIVVSGAYVGVVFALLFVQPDFGSAAIVFAMWLGTVLVAGISKKHLMAVFAIGLTAGACLWFFGFAEYQKERILTFLDPLADIRGAGYNAYQSTIAVGSGGLFGKGIGNGSQSKLEFLPEYETDFIFAAIAEEWGLAGVGIVIVLFGTLFWRLVVHARYGASNFETLICVGIILWFLAHTALHIGMNVGLLPVTGTIIPFLSYGGSHLVTEFAAIGLVLAMARYERPVRHEDLTRLVEGFEGA